jgi:hypothetical protein
LGCLRLEENIFSHFNTIPSTPISTKLSLRLENSDRNFVFTSWLSTPVLVSFVLSSLLLSPQLRWAKSTNRPAHFLTCSATRLTVPSNARCPLSLHY